MHLARAITGFIDLEEKFRQRVEGLLSQNWKLEGPPSFIIQQDRLYACQDVEQHRKGHYEAFVSIKDLPPLPPDNTSKFQRYRLIFGKDDSSFCARTEKILNMDWRPLGPTQILSAGGFVVAARAFTKFTSRPYHFVAKPDDIAPEIRSLAAPLPV